ncbi:MAG: tetratricopeptide repeat protein [Pirellulaceae bacterium]
MHHQNHRLKDHPEVRPNHPTHAAADARVNSALVRATEHIAQGRYERALTLLESAGRDLEVRNARGVCLLRLRRPAAAIGVLRDVALQAGCTWVRKDVPICYAANYATALLLGGHPAGCLEILGEVDSRHPSVQRLRSAIRNWEATLTWWQRLNWKFGRVEPDNRPVALDFLPGEFPHEVTCGDRPVGGKPDVPPQTAA